MIRSSYLELTGYLLGYSQQLIVVVDELLFDTKQIKFKLKSKIRTLQITGADIIVLNFCSYKHR